MQFLRWNICVRHVDGNPPSQNASRRLEGRDKEEEERSLCAQEIMIISYLALFDEFTILNKWESLCWGYLADIKLVWICFQAHFNHASSSWSCFNFGKIRSCGSWCEWGMDSHSEKNVYRPLHWRGALLIIGSFSPLSEWGELMTACLKTLNYNFYLSRPFIISEDSSQNFWTDCSD